MTDYNKRPRDMEEKEEVLAYVRAEQSLALRMMQLAYLVQTHTDFCVFIRFSGHVNTLDIEIAKSKEDWKTILFEAETMRLYQEQRKNSAPKLAHLQTKIQLLEQILSDGEIPFEDLEFVEESIGYYKF